MILLFLLHKLKRFNNILKYYISFKKMSVKIFSNLFINDFIDM